MNRQSRDTGNIEHKTKRKQIKNHNKQSYKDEQHRHHKKT